MFRWWSTFFLLFVSWSFPDFWWFTDGVLLMVGAARETRIIIMLNILLSFLVGWCLSLVLTCDTTCYKGKIRETLARTARSWIKMMMIMMMMMMMVVVNTLTISVHSKRTYDGKDSTVPIECQQSFSPSKYWIQHCMYLDIKHNYNSTISILPTSTIVSLLHSTSSFEMVPILGPSSCIWWYHNEKRCIISSIITASFFKKFVQL